MKHFLFVSWALVCAFQIPAAKGEPGLAAARRNGIPTEAINAPRVRDRQDREKELPPTDEITVKGKVEDLYGRIYFSEAIGLKNPKFVVDTDPILAELNLMDKLIKRVKSKEIPAEEAHLIVTRYHLADERVFQRLKQAFELGIATDVITDFNDSVDVEFKKGEDKITDFTSNRVKPNSSPNGQFLKKLLELGYEYGTPNKKPKFGLYSQPVFNKKLDEETAKKMFDIMHEKGVVAAWIKANKVKWVEATAGSANMVAHAASVRASKNKDLTTTRVNTVREITHEALAERRLEHARSLRDNFAKGGSISDTPTENFLRVNTDNGWVETGFTNGEHNLNDRIAAFLLHATPGMTKDLVAQGFDKGVESYFDRIAKEFGGWKIEEIREMEFVNTYSQGREAEKLLFEGNRDVKKLGLYDAKFNEVRGFGFPPIQVGVDLLRPMGGTMFALKKEIADRMDTNVYLRRLPGIPETDLDGPPLSRYLLHTKLYMIRGKLKDGTEVTVIFDGSLNKSNHKENAEDQDLIVVLGKSEMADGYWSLPELLLKAQKEHFFKGERELLMDVYARFTGHSPLEITRQFEERVTEHVAKGDLAKVKAELEKLADEPSELKKRPSRQEIQKRIDRLADFFEWHKKNYPWNYGKGENFYLRKLLEVPTIMSNDTIEAGQAAWALRGLLWARDLTPEQIDERAAEAWKLIGRTDPFPKKEEHNDDRTGDQPRQRGGTTANLAGRQDAHSDKTRDKAVTSSVEAGGGNAADCEGSARKVSGRDRRASR